jgi:hypothetical protein
VSPVVVAERITDARSRTGVARGVFVVRTMSELRVMVGGAVRAVVPRVVVLRAGPVVSRNTVLVAVRATVVRGAGASFCGGVRVDTDCGRSRTVVVVLIAGSIFAVARDTVAFVCVVGGNFCFPRVATGVVVCVVRRDAARAMSVASSDQAA